MMDCFGQILLFIYQNYVYHPVMSGLGVISSVRVFLKYGFVCSSVTVRKLLPTLDHFLNVGLSHKKIPRFTRLWRDRGNILLPL